MRLKKITNYACYYGTGRLLDMAAFDLVILQPAHYTIGQIKFLRARGTRTIAYLSIGETAKLDSAADWYMLEPQSRVPARNPRWQTTFVDCRAPAWQAHLLQRRIPDILARGFEGLFLDTLDVQDLYPETRSAVICLLHRIRDQYPNLILVANRGFSILERVIADLDVVAFEAFSTYYDNGCYQAWGGSDQAWTETIAAQLRVTCSGCPILALDYAAPDDHRLRSIAKSRAREHGFLSFVSTYALDWLPESRVGNA